MRSTLYCLSAWRCRVRWLPVCWLILLHCRVSHAQEDSLTIYHKLEQKADQHKVTRWIFDAIFVDPDDVNPEADSIIVVQNNRSLKVTNPFLAYANRPIRSVTIQVLDPFGYSVNDTFKSPSRGIQKLGNRYHVTTRKRVIGNLILFKEGDRVDPIKLSESERLLRQAPYVNDARIYVRTTYRRVKGKKRKLAENDSLDVIVRVLDKWSLEPNSNFDVNKPDVSLTENNFAGIGHQLNERVVYDMDRKMLANSGKYGVYNIKNTYVSTSLSYYYDNLQTSVAVNFDRPFYSPLTKWAGGAGVSKSYAHYPYLDSVQNTEYQFPLDFSTVDVWAGRNFRVGNKRKLKDKVSNIIVGARYVQLQFQQRPLPEYDPYNTLLDQSLYLVNTGFSTTKYYKDRYITRFGANEDIPLGFSVQLIGGYRQLELESDRYYSGFSISNSHLFSKMYLQTTVSYGAFHNKNSTHKGVASLELSGFSNLMQFGRWYFRQFARFKYVTGINRDEQENLTLQRSELYGFYSDQLLGKTKSFVNLETIIYTPYNVIGFRFAPIIMFGFGQVGNNMSDVFSGRVYQAYSLGLLIRNENLLFNTFEVTFGLYPHVPGTAGPGYSAGISSGRMARFSNFSIGKPDVLPYN